MTLGRGMLESDRGRRSNTCLLNRGKDSVSFSIAWTFPQTGLSGEAEWNAMIQHSDVGDEMRSEYRTVIE